MILILLFFCNYIYGSEHRSITMYSVSNITRESCHEDFCDEALRTFMRRTDSDLAKYIRPQLVSLVKDATSSPESDDEQASPSPKRIARRLAASPDLVRQAPRQEIDEVVLAAVQKAFEEKEAAIAHKEKKIEGMFSKKATAAITTVVGIIVTIVSSLGSVYGTMNNFGNCTK
jgi:hypothetical protein